MELNANNESVFNLVDVHINFTLPISMKNDVYNHELYSKTMNFILLTVESLRVALKQVHTALDVELEY